MKNFFLPLLLMILLLTGCGNTADIPGTKHGNKIVVGLDDSYAPMGFHDKDGNLVGFDIDLAKEASRRLGVKFEFQPIDWHNKEQEITSGNIDIIWNGCDITDERKTYMIFSKPYMENRQILLVRLGNDLDIHTAGDLTGKVVGTQAGSSSEDYVKNSPTLKNGFAEFKTYRNYIDAFMDLHEKKVDALICDEIVARYELSKIPQKFEVIEVTIGSVCDVGIGFRKEDTELRKLIQKVFDEMIADGTAKKISEKWFKADLIKHRK